MPDIQPQPSSRNAPCPCGSGRRYKDCHGALTTGSDRDAEIQRTMQTALASQRAGQHREALRHYGSALELDPENFDAMHMAGVVHYQLGEFDQAIAWIGRAKALRPDLPAVRRNLLLAEFASKQHGRDIAYRNWIDRFDTPSAEVIARWRSEAALHPAPLSISIAMPTYNSPDRWLRACLDSVLAQTWPHWELCIADDASSLTSTRATLNEYAMRDARIQVELRRENGGIAAASNSALARVSGEYVALLDHDDELAPWALQLVAATLTANPDTLMLYSDEDKIDEDGSRYEPYFKPGWDPVLLTAQNYISHLGVYRTERLQALGGFRLGYDGAQDWDLALRVSESAASGQIIHVPRVLYHWRAIEGSTARAIRNKAYADSAQQRAIAAHVSRLGGDATITRATDGGFLQTDPMLAGSRPGVLLVVLRRGRDAAVESGARWSEFARDAGHDVVFVSADPGKATLADAGDVPALDRHAAAAVNAAVGHASTGVVVLIDEGLTALTSNWLDLLVRHASQASVGAVGGLLCDGQLCAVHAGYILDRYLIAASPYAGYPREWVKATLRGGVVQSLSAVGLACMAVRKRLWDEVGGLDTETLAARYRDVDFCLRLEEAGYRNRWHPGVELAYAHPLRSRADSSSASDEEHADRSAMQRRWGPRLAAVRAYNPNLAAAPRLFELNEFEESSRGPGPLSSNPQAPREA